MIKNLLLSTLISVGVGASVTIPSERVPTPIQGNNFVLLSEFFPTYTLEVVDNYLIFEASLTKLQATAKPYAIYNQLFIGDFINKPLSEISFLNNGGQDYYALFEQVNDFDVSFPFINGYLNDNVSDRFYPYLYGRALSIDYADLHGSYNLKISFEFTQNILPQAKVVEYEQIFLEQVGFANRSAIADYIEQEKNISYVEGTAVAEGGWLGNMIFGTIGGMVGFLFAVSDFEVLGVSIMSIITLFVAISMVMLLLKAFK